MSQSEASDSGLEVGAKFDHLDVAEFTQVQPAGHSSESPEGDDAAAKAVPKAVARPVPLAKPLQSNRRLPTAAPQDSPSFSQKVRRRWRGDPQTAAGGREPKIGIEVREKPPFQFKDLFTWRALQKNLGYLISFWAHLLLFLVLSLIVVSAGIGDSPLFLDAVAAPADAEEASLEIVDLAADLELEAQPEQNHLEDLFEEQLAVEESRNDAVKSIDDLKPQDLLASSSGAASKIGRERGDGKSATFFGTKAAGRRFVFVVDRSASMRNGSQNFRSDELFNRFDVATSEMLSAVSSLQPHQEFFVLMFVHNTIPMFGQQSLEQSGDRDFETIPATRENKIRLQQWVESVKMGGGTDPRRAIEVAISMQPDAIFMLSDGQFISEMGDHQPKTLDIVRSHAAVGTIVPINTISLVVEDTIPVMEEIAERSGGCLLYTSPSPRDRTRSRMPSSA